MNRISFLKTTAISFIFLASVAQAKHGGGNKPSQPHQPGSGTPTAPASPGDASGAPSAPAGAVDETCLSHGKPLDVINDQVLQWKTSTANAFVARARIQGTVDEVFPDHSGHRHFSLKIGPQATDHIEVIYNLSFGKLPTPTVGMAAEACGDYITSISQTGGYPASPDGAIIHWVHRSPSGHEPGYVILNGVKY